MYRIFCFFSILSINMTSLSANMTSFLGESMTTFALLINTNKAFLDFSFFNYCTMLSNNKQLLSIFVKAIAYSILITIFLFALSKWFSAKQQAENIQVEQITYHSIEKCVQNKTAHEE